MYKNAVFYKNTWLAPNSKAYELYHTRNKSDKAKKEFEQHMKNLDKKV